MTDDLRFEIVRQNRFCAPNAPGIWIEAIGEMARGKGPGRLRGRLILDGPAGDLEALGDVGDRLTLRIVPVESVAFEEVDR